MAVDHLVESASVGWWVAERNRDGLGEEAESCFGEDVRDAVHIQGQCLQEVGVVVGGGAPANRLE